MDLSPEIDELVAVTSRSFSKDPYLRACLLKRFTNVRFNSEGRRFGRQGLLEFLSGARRAIIALDKIDLELLEALPTLRIISKYGVGTDAIDFSALKERQILFGWQPGVNRQSVAELALGMMLALAREIPQHTSAMQRKLWQPRTGVQLGSSSVGIVGFGNVGQELARIVGPLGSKILFHDIIDLSHLNADNCRQATLDEVLKCRFVSIHVPLNAGSKNLIAKREFGFMSSDSYLVNTSRGGVVDEEALFDTLQAGRIAGAASDVFATEPPTDSRLLTLPHFISTPHVGGSTRTSIRLMGEAAIDGLFKAFAVG